MKDHELVISAFQRVVFHRDRSTPHEARLRQLSRDFKTSFNIRIGAATVLWKLGLMDDVEYDMLLATVPGEGGSPLYDTWGQAFVSIVSTPRAREFHRAWLALRVLTNVDATHYRLNDGRIRARNYGMAGWRGPVSGLAGNRAIMDEGKVSKHWERSLAGPWASWAIGMKGSWHGSSHRDYGWAMKAQREHGRPPSLLNEARDYEALAAVAGRVRTSPRQGWTIIKSPLGDQLTVMDISTRHTRGPAMVTHFSRNGLLRIFSPSKDTGRGGVWTKCISRDLRIGPDGTTVTLFDMDRGVKQPLSFPSLTSRDTRIRLDKDGCRVLGAPEAPQSDEDGLMGILGKHLNAIDHRASLAVDAASRGNAAPRIRQLMEGVETQTNIIRRVLAQRDQS